MTASAKPRLWLNSPASVLGMLPPHIEFPSLNRKSVVAAAATAGSGNGKPMARNDTMLESGMRNVPVTVTSLKAMLNGTTSDRHTTISAGSRK